MSSNWEYWAGVFDATGTIDIFMDEVCLLFRSMNRAILEKLKREVFPELNDLSIYGPKTPYTMAAHEQEQILSFLSHIKTWLSVKWNQVDVAQRLLTLDPKDPRNILILRKVRDQLETINLDEYIEYRKLISECKPAPLGAEEEEP
jgi:hypothetical protein